MAPTLNLRSGRLQRLERSRSSRKRTGLSQEPSDELVWEEKFDGMVRLKIKDVGLDPNGPAESIEQEKLVLNPPWV